MCKYNDSSLNIPITLLRGENNSGTDSLAGACHALFNGNLIAHPPGVLHTICTKGYRPQIGAHVLNKNMCKYNDSSLNIPITLLRGENNSGTDSLAGACHALFNGNLIAHPPGVLHTICTKGYRPQIGAHVLNKNMCKYNDSSLNIPITLLRGENNSGTDSLAGACHALFNGNLIAHPPGVLHTICTKGYRPHLRSPVIR